MLKRLNYSNRVSFECASPLTLARSLVVSVINCSGIPYRMGHATGDTARRMRSMRARYAAVLRTVSCRRQQAPETVSMNHHVVEGAKEVARRKAVLETGDHIESPISAVEIGPWQHRDELKYAIGEMISRKRLFVDVGLSDVTFRNW